MEAAAKAKTVRLARPPPVPIRRHAGTLAPQTGALIQPALKVGPANDPLEREAEITAERVISMAAPEKSANGVSPNAKPMIIGRMPAFHTPDCLEREVVAPETATGFNGEYDDAAPLSADDPNGAVVGSEGGDAPQDVSSLVANPGPGRALPVSVCQFMEPRFGRDFSNVRIHDGVTDRNAAHRIGARAFTHGKHIWMGDGESVDNRRLMAHELTHVVQQTGDGQHPSTIAETHTALHRDFDVDFNFDIGLSESIGNMVRGLLRRFAPEVEPIITRGPVTWLREQLSVVFDGIISSVGRLDPGNFVESLVTTFSDMAETATEIVSALIRGDCEPLFNALGKMKNFVLKVAGNAWDKLSDFFSPVGDFFSNLWTSITATGSDAIDWIKDFAGDIWETIEEIGEFIWDKAAVILKNSGLAWAWVKEQLFGPADPPSQGDSRDGIVSWFTAKATDAWDWVKDQTRPVWEPISEAIETIQELIPPAFVAELGEKMETFSDDLNETVDDMDGGPGVAENREAVAELLPSVQDIITTIREKLVLAGLWIISAIGTVSTKVTTFMARLRGNSLVSGLASRLTWLETAVSSLSSWATDKANGLFNLLVLGFDFLSPWIQKIINVVSKVIDVATDLLLLPQLIIERAWGLIPECIREPIKEFIITEILGRIPVFSQFASIGNLWNKLQETAFSILRSLFVDGDIAKAAWTFFRDMLALIGLPTRLVVSILTKAASAVGKILRDPIGFLINMMNAMREGFSRFFDNVHNHLLEGITGWLFGHVREAGLEPPTEFSVGGVLDFVLQLLDITVERVLERLALQIGQEKVDKIRNFLNAATGVWRFVSVLINDGISGLWEFVQEQLSGLWDQVLDAVIGWVTQRIITAVTFKLLSMLDPSGIMAVIQSAIAIYRAIESLVAQLRAMLEIVSKVLDGIGGIASGAIGIAAGYLENAMASSLPVAITFLANQAGLSSLSTRIGEFVEAVRERVDSAIDWLIDNGIRLGQGFLNMLERGTNAVRDWWRARKEFRNEAGEEHSVYIEGRGGNARVMIASEDPQNYSEFLNNADVPIGEKAAAVAINGQLDDALTAAARDENRDGVSDDGAAQPSAVNHAQHIQESVDGLATETLKIMESEEGADNTLSSSPEYGTLVKGYGKSAKVTRLKLPVPPGGSPTSGITSPNMSTLLKRRNRQVSYYVRGHLLNSELGGPGNTWDNLTPITRSANARHYIDFEKKVKDAVEAEGIISFNVAAEYNRTSRAEEINDLEATGSAHDQQIASILRAEEDIPSKLAVEAHEIGFEGERSTGLSINDLIENEINENTEEYQLQGTPPPQPVYLSEMTGPEIASSFNLTAAVANRIERISGFRNWSQVAAVEGVGQSTADGMRNKRDLRVRLYRQR